MSEGFIQWKKASQIILGIDIGATQTAVSFAFLFQGYCVAACIISKSLTQIFRLGGNVSVKRVSDWPGQSEQSTSKIPTQIYYDTMGQVRVLLHDCPDTTMMC
jgi:hypothetical protein